MSKKYNKIVGMIMGSAFVIFIVVGIVINHLAEEREYGLKIKGIVQGIEKLKHSKSTSLLISDEWYCVNNGAIKSIEIGDSIMKLDSTYQFRIKKNNERYPRWFIGDGSIGKVTNKQSVKKLNWAIQKRKKRLYTLKVNGIVDNIIKLESSKSTSLFINKRWYDLDDRTAEFIELGDSIVKHDSTFRFQIKKNSNEFSNWFVGDSIIDKVIDRRRIKLLNRAAQSKIRK
jgi:hypothetical protein